MKFRGRLQSPPALCLPDEDGWRLWAFPGGGAPPAAVPVAAGEVAAVPSGTRIALPARHVVAIPMWFQTIDATAFRDLAGVELERRGLLRDGAAWDYLPIRQEETRSLVSVFLLDPSLPSSLLVPQAEAYEVAARCRPLPGDAFVAWREHGGLVLAAARDSRLVSLHFFPGPVGCDDVARELRALRRGLLLEGAMSREAGCVAWGEFAPDEVAALDHAFGGPPRREPPPPPAVPEPPLALLPPEVKAGQRRRAGRRRLIAYGLYAAAAYLALLLAGSGAFGWQAWERQKLSREKQALAPDVARSQAAAARWRALAPAIDSTYYPMEFLLAMVKVIPPEVRLTEFEHTPGKALLVGEGRDAAAAFRFLEAVKGDPLLKKWSWVMPQPQLLPNNRAQFRMEGTREGKAAH